MTSDLRVEFDMPAAMRDGVVLRANVFRPAAEGSYPVALCRTPYGKDVSGLGPILDVLRLTRAGYIVVIQDVRGRGTSEGAWSPFRYESQDGYDSVVWAAELPGASGSVGMFGASYVGFTQWVTAIGAPPQLKAIMPTVTWADADDGFFWRGGAFELGLIANLYLAGFGFDVIQREHPELQGPDALAARRRLAQEIDCLPNGGYLALQQSDYELLKQFGLSDDLAEAIAAGVSPVYSSPFGQSSAYTQVKVPTYNVGGWYDLFAQGTLQNFAAMRSSPRPKARQSKLLMGPWSHVNFGSVVGEMDFGLAASLGSVDMQDDLTALTQRWFDYWLKGIQNGIVDEPPVKLFIMGENCWRDEEEWPLARTQYVPFYLRSGFVLSPEAPGQEPSDSYVYNPATPTQVNGGAVQMHGLYSVGVKDQAVNEQCEDMLIYTSEPLAQDTEVTGPVVAELWVSNSASSADFVACLIDVHPNGFAQNLTDGIARAQLKENQPTQVTVDLWSTANVFKAGHRIRLQISSAAFPRWDVNSNAGLTPTQSTTRQGVLHDTVYPSYVLLPLIPR